MFEDAHHEPEPNNSLNILVPCSGPGLGTRPPTSSGVVWLDPSPRFRELHHSSLLASRTNQPSAVGQIIRIPEATENNSTRPYENDIDRLFRAINHLTT